MASITLPGNIVDITTKPVEDTTRVTVKAPRPRPSEGVISTQPQDVPLDSRGGFTLTVEEGLGWLYIDGNGWSDSIRFVAKAGMSSFTEAWMNAGQWPIPLPIVDDAISRVSDALDGALDKIGQAQGWLKGQVDGDLDNYFTSGSVGHWVINTTGVTASGEPIGERGHLLVAPYSKGFVQTFLGENGTVKSRYKTGTGKITAWAEKYAAKNDLPDWTVGTIPSDATLETWLRTAKPGVWAVPTISLAKNLGIPKPNAGTILVTQNGSMKQAAFFGIQGTTVSCYLTSSGTLVPWKGFVDSLQVPSGLTLDTWLASASTGVWGVGNGGIAEALGLENPEAGTIVVNEIGSMKQAVFLGISGAVQSSYRTSTGVTTQWQRLGASTSSGSQAPGSRAMMVRDDLRRSRGGRIGTGGKAVVALRFDHYPEPFIRHVLPTLKRLGLPATMACYVDMDTREQYPDTWDTVRDNFFKGVEVFSHSWTHREPGGPDGYDLHKEVFESRVELERLLPDVKVHGWAHPGTDGNYSNWWLEASKDPLTAMTFPQGQEIASTYGCFNLYEWGGFGAQGSQIQTFIGLDNRTDLADATERVDKAIASGGSLVFMVHPNVFDRADRLDADTFTQVLEYIAAKRDEGDLLVLSLSGLSLADPSTAWRQTLAPRFSSWSRTGDTSTVTIDLSVVKHFRGVPWQLRFSGSGVATVSISSDVSGHDTSRRVSLAGSEAIVPFGVPRTATTLTVTVTGAVADAVVEAV